MRLKCDQNLRKRASVRVDEISEEMRLNETKMRPELEKKIKQKTTIRYFSKASAELQRNFTKASPRFHQNFRKSIQRTLKKGINEGIMKVRPTSLN